MVAHRWSWFMILLCLGSSAGQTQAATNKALDDIKEFLEEIRNNVTSFTDLNKNELVENVKKVKSDINAKISELRAGELSVDPTIIEAEENLSKFGVDALTILLKILGDDPDSGEISKLIVSFREDVGNEILRILLLPIGTGQGSVPTPTNDDDCPSCEVYDDIYKYLERNSNPPPISFTDLTSVTETINTKITELLNTKDLGQCHQDQLETLQDIKDGRNGKEGVEEVVRKLRDKAKDEDALKILASRNLKRIMNDVDSERKKCLVKRKNRKAMASCLEKKLKDAIKFMTTLEKSLKGKAESDLAKKNIGDQIFEDISQNNEIYLEVLESKFNNEEFDLCEESFGKLFQDSLREPMYEIYNAARTASSRPCPICITALEKAITDQISLLEKTLERKDVKSPVLQDISSTSSTSKTTCESGEYEHTKRYLEEVDNIIEDSLLALESNSSRMDALTGFVTIKRLLTEREESLHQDQLVGKCPKELNFIRKQYMGVLDQCLKELLDKKDAEFEKLTGKEKISCPKKLRDKMEKRFGQLFSSVFKAIGEK